MNLSAGDLALYAGALLVLFITPGPVWLALLARSLSGGAGAALPLAAGVATGDVLWSLLAVLGLGWAAASLDGAMGMLRLLAVGVFVVMGLALIRRAGRAVAADSRLTRPGAWAGFVAGLVAIVGNPKAMLFYMGVLPGFFDLSRTTAADVTAIVGLSAAVPLAGNVSLALGVGRLRRWMSSPTARRRIDIAAGGLLIAVGAAIALA